MAHERRNNLWLCFDQNNLIWNVIVKNPLCHSSYNALELSRPGQTPQIPPSCASPHKAVLNFINAVALLCGTTLCPQERQRGESNPCGHCKDEGHFVLRQKANGLLREEIWQGELKIIRQEGKGSYKSKMISFWKLKIESIMNCGRLVIKTLWDSPEESLSNNPHKALKACNTIMWFRTHQEQEFCLNVCTARRPSVCKCHRIFAGFFWFFFLLNKLWKTWEGSYTSSFLNKGLSRKPISNWMSVENIVWQIGEGGED